MKNISILKKIKRCLRKTNHHKKLNFKKIKFTTDLNCLYIDQLRYEHQYYKKASVFFLLKELEQNLYVVLPKGQKTYLPIQVKYLFLVEELTKKITLY